MSLMSRDDYEQEIKRLERRQAEFGRLLSSCVYCDTQLQPVEISADWLAPWGMKLTCEGCGNPRETAISADDYALASRELERQKQHARNKLVMTGVTIADAKKTLASGRFAWVIGARKEHERWCAKKQEKRYCSCNGIWLQTSSKGIRIRCGGKNWICYSLRPVAGIYLCADGLMEIQKLERMGVTVMEYVFREKSDREPKPEEPVYALPWQRIPIAELDAYKALAGWMIRYPADILTATHFEACEVGV